MFAAIGLSLLLLLGILPSVEEGYLELFVKDATGKLLRDVDVGCKEKCSVAVSDSRGRARLKLPPQLHSDDWVSLQIVKRAGGPNWTLISPWDDRLNIPSFANKTENNTTVVVVRKGDKQILKSGVALQALAERCVGILVVKVLDAHNAPICGIRINVEEPPTN
jgi:hypothetical protein